MRIAIIPGDGIGKEVIAAGVEVLQALAARDGGFKLDFETDHGSGQLMASNGTRLFIAETSPEDPVGMDVYLGADQAGVAAPEQVDVVFDWTPTHWGTRVMTVRDPDGRLFRIEAPPAEE